MGLEPLHPDEVVLHRQLRDALNEQLTTPAFLVWITVEPTGEGAELATVEQIVRTTDEWLTSLNPETIATPDAVPEKRFLDPAAEVRIRAVPKNPEARGHRSHPIVGNPEPALAGFV